MTNKEKLLAEIIRVYGKKVTESCCCDQWESYAEEVTGYCPDCNGPVVEGGISASGCNYSSITCDTCRHAPCDGSC
jgi:hypothetical protein